MGAQRFRRASTVGGRIVDLAAEQNGREVEGDFLFRIDPKRSRLAAKQAGVDRELAESAPETPRRVLATQYSAATVAADKHRRTKQCPTIGSVGHLALRVGRARS